MTKLIKCVLLIIILVSAAGNCVCSAESANIRVGLYYNGTAKAETVLESNGRIDVTGGAEPYYYVRVVFENESGGMSVYNSENVLIAGFKKNEQCLFVPEAGDLSLDGKKYRGMCEITATDSGLKIINILSIDEYICGVLPNEIYPSWGKEALKAAAVTARSFTWAKAQGSSHHDDGFDLCTTTHCQVYRGMSTEAASTNEAVFATEGEVVKYGGSVVSTVYSSNSGGYTEGSENVWYAAVPYYVSKPDPYTEPNTWTVNYTADEIEQKLKKIGKNIGKVRNITIDETAPSGRAIKLTIHGENGLYSLEKDNIRSFFERKSTLFTVSSSGGVVKSLIAAIIEMENSVDGGGAFKLATLNGGADSFIFNGKGYGHGVGMSQWGCKNMSDLGFGYRDIIAFYFEGTTVTAI